jgi:hypothetical protein
MSASTDSTSTVSASRVTHLKLFVEQDKRQVALYSGPDESRDWLRNELAEVVLQSGWHLLPKESLMTLASVHEQGLLTAAFEPGSASPAPSMTWAWAMRAAALAAQQADRAATANDPVSEASSCSRVVQFLEQAAGCPIDPHEHDAITQKRAAWLVRAVNARLSAWTAEARPEHAEALAQLFAALADGSWDADASDRDKAHKNHLFWRRRAAAAWSELSQQAEQNGDLAQAEASAAAVLRLLTTMAA